VPPPQTAAGVSAALVKRSERKAAVPNASGLLLVQVAQFADASPGVSAVPWYFDGPPVRIQPIGPGAA
jgi:hypothetical protein